MAAAAVAPFRFGRVLAVFFLLAVLVSLAGTLAYRSLAGSLQQRESERLMAIAELKAGQVAGWLNERRSDARALAGSAPFIRIFHHWQTAPTESARSELLLRLASMRDAYGYDSIEIYDATGSRRLGVGRLSHARLSAHADEMTRARTQDAPALIDLHQDGAAPTIRVGYVVTLRDVTVAERPVVGYALFYMDARQALYPMIQTWPLPSVSGESLIARRDGDAVLFLSDSRYRPNAAFNLRLPLSRTELPTVQALRGGDRVYQGRDYRGVPVLAAVHRVPGTRWLLLAKIDEAELFQEINRLAIMSLVVVLAVIALAAALLALIWRQQRLRQTKALLKEQRLAASVFTAASEGIFITDVNATILEVNDAFTRVTGYRRDEAIGRNPRMLQSGHQDKAFYAAMWATLLATGTWRGELHNRRKNGEVFIEQITITAVKNEAGATTHYVGLFSDITESKRQRDQVEHLAYYDALTQLPNRVLFFDRFQQALARAARTGERVALCYLDLDGFKAVNDRLGHKAGDLLLIEVARRLGEAIRRQDTAARLGGDEFVLLLADVGSNAACEQALERVVGAINQPYRLDDGVVDWVSASVGVALFPDDGDDPDVLLRLADQAMFKAKEAGRRRVRFVSGHWQVAGAGGADSVGPRVVQGR